jgi:hypothetical protein
MLCMALDGGSIRADTTLLAYGQPIFAGHLLGVDLAQRRQVLVILLNGLAFMTFTLWK